MSSFNRWVSPRRTVSATSGVLNKTSKATRRPLPSNRITNQPAKILGIDAGTLSVGEKADICIYNPQTSWIVDPDKMLSSGHNTPFSGWELKGKVTHTLLNGNIVYQA